MADDLVGLELGQEFLEQFLIDTQKVSADDRSALKVAYDVMGESIVGMSNFQLNFLLQLVRSGDLNRNEIKEAMSNVPVYNPNMGVAEQDVRTGTLTSDQPQKEMSESEFYRRYFGYEGVLPTLDKEKYKELDEDDESILEGPSSDYFSGYIVGQEGEPQGPVVIDKLPQKQDRIAMSTGGNTSGFPTDVIGNYGSFSTMTPISTQQYLSGPVDFYRQTLGTGIQSSVIDDDDQKKEEEEDTAPNIFKPIGSDDGDRENMSTLSLGLDADKSGFDPASVNSYNTFDVKVPGMDYTDAGFFSDQSADLVQDFAGNFFDNLGDINQKAFKGFGDVVSGDVSLSDALKSFGQGAQMPGPTGKMRTMTAPPAVLMAMGPYSGFFGGLAALGGAANMAIQKQNAAIFKATGAGAFMDINGMMVSRKPGSFQYSGNLSGMSQEQIKNIEAIKNGFLVGTMKAETYKDGEWSRLSGDKDVIQSDDVFKNGGTFNANGNWTDISGQGYSMPTKQNVADYTAAFNARWGTNFSTDFVSETYKSIETTWSLGTGTTVKPGTKNMQQKMTDAAIAERMSKVGGYQFGDAYAGTSAASTALGFDPSITPGAAYKRTGMADFFTDEAKAQRAAEAKAEQDRRDRAAAQAAEQKRREEAAKSGTTSKSDPYGGAANDGGGAFGGLSDRETESAKGSNPGDKSSWASGGRVGYQEGGETGFVERPEFVGGNQSQPDKVSIADDQPRDVPEGTFVINAAAADFAGRDDIEKMIREAYQKVGDTGQSGISQEVQIAVSKGEVLIPPHIAKIIGYDRLNKINNRGKKEISRRQKAEADRPQVDRPVPVNKGGFISKKKFHKGGGVGHSHAAQSDPSSRSNFQVEMDELIKKQDEQANRESQTPSLNTPGEKLRYRKGVEFGDIEVYADILGKTNYNSLIQAAARDTRTLSDYVKTLPQGEEVASYWDKPLGQYREGAYSKDILNKGPYDSGIVMKNPAFFSTPDGAPKKGYTAVLAHELMHKGADTLSNDPNFKPSEALVAMQRQYSKIPTIIDEGGTEAAKQRVSQGDAEHRYIASVIGQAYLNRDMESLTGTMENYQRRNIPITDYEAKFTTKADGTVDYDLIAFYRAVDKEDISVERKYAVRGEIQRVYNLYLTDENRAQFLAENKQMFEDDYGGIPTTIDQIQDIPYSALLKSYASINRIMAEDYMTKLFEGAVANKPVDIPRMEKQPDPEIDLPQEPVYERGFLDRILGVTPAY